MRIWLALLALPPLAAQQRPHELCVACHQEQTADFKSHPHFAKGLSCDACHGPSDKHRTSTGAVPPDRVAAPDEVPALCGACHSTPQKEFLASRHNKRLSQRARVKTATCVTCHGHHALRQTRAMERQCGRCHASLPASCKAQPAREVPASAVSCTGCHQKHTLVAAK